MWIWILAGTLGLLGGMFYLVARRARPAPSLAPERSVRPPGQAPEHHAQPGHAPERDHATVLLREEELQLKKTREQLAEVTTHTEVSRELKTVTVPVTREELVVEKNGVEVARIPLREDRIEVSTHSVELNDVSVHTREWIEEKEIQAVLKKEVARIETTGTATYSEESDSG